jgi:adenylate kinase family enzyme
MKDTIIINFFGGPGIGKSTQSSELFTLMKKKPHGC